MGLAVRGSVVAEGSGGTSYIGSGGMSYIRGSAEGSGLGRLSGKSLWVTEKGLSIVEGHLARSEFESVPYNFAQIDRLREALVNNMQISGGDASFYMHELAEATLMNRGISYEIAHPSAISKYGVSPYSLYSPEVIQMYPEYFHPNYMEFWKNR